MNKRKAQNPLVQGDVISMRDGSFIWDMPIDTLRALTATGVTGSGVVLANVSQRFSIIHTDDKGDLPVNYSVSVRITRDPLVGNDTERDAVDKAAAESKANQDLRKRTETEDRQKSVKAAVDMTREMLRDGMAMANVRQPNVVDTIKQLAEVAPVLKQLKEAI